MSMGHIRRADIGELIDREFTERRAKALPVDFNWFTSRFDHHFRKENEPVPSRSTIARFLKRVKISLQSVRDHKSKTVEERLDSIRDYFLRRDNLQRTSPSNTPRISPCDTYSMDEFCIVIKPPCKKSYNRVGSESNHCKELGQLASRAASGLVCFRMGGEPFHKLWIIFPLSPKKIFSVDDQGNKTVIGWDVRRPAANRVMKEFETYKKYKNVIPLFWPSAMAREPIMKAFGEDLINLLVEEGPREREMLLDWYDSHTYEPYLRELKVKASMINTFYPAGATDIVAAPDGGLIKLIQDKFRKALA